jgi:hypothetical protein
MENDLITLKTDCKLTNVPSSIEPAMLKWILVKRITTFIDTAQQPTSQLTLSRGYGTGNLSYKQSQIFYDNIRFKLHDQVKLYGNLSNEYSEMPNENELIQLNTLFKKNPPFKDYAKFNAKVVKLVNPEVIDFSTSKLFDGVNNFDI